MTAGTGVKHSEFNHSQEDQVHFLQIWILPEKNGLEPGYEQKNFSQTDKQGKLCLIGSQDGRNGSVTIHQDVNLYASSLHKGDEIIYQPTSGRKLWIQVARGRLEVNGLMLHAGDGVSLEDEESVFLRDGVDAEILLFDMMP